MSDTAATQWTDACGVTYFYDAEGRLHRDEDKPAVVGPWCRRWYVHGELYREGGKPQELQRLANDDWVELWWSQNNNYFRPVKRQWHGTLEERTSGGSSGLM